MHKLKLSLLTLLFFSFTNSFAVKYTIAVKEISLNQCLTQNSSNLLDSLGKTNFTGQFSFLNQFVNNVQQSIQAANHYTFVLIKDGK
ncbi:MAG: hypothetical protein HRT87_08190 [Legionellales bacterium]|nr:hypothetical protein [Legionellales bacterium]